MVYKTEKWSLTSEISQINHNFQEKDSGYYCWKLRKRKIKHLKIFQKLLEQSNQSPQCNHSRARAIEEMFMKKTDQELDISGNTGTYHT